MPLRWNSTLKPSGVSLPYTWISLQEQRSTEHRERQTDAKYNPEGEDA